MDQDNTSVMDTSSSVFSLGTTNSVSEENDDPEDFTLSQNFPNPFNPATIIDYQLSMNSFVTLKIYDLLGREVALLVNGRQGAGSHSVTFDAGNLPSGIYLCQLGAAGFREVRKMVLMK